MELFGYRKLIVYQKSKELVRHTYRLLNKFPSIEKHAMCDQLRRASISITSNIAEDLGYISMQERYNVDKLVEEIARLLSGLRNSFK